MVEKAPRGRAEIERLVLCGLQDCPGCEGAAGISIMTCGSSADPCRGAGANWTVRAFNPGTADSYRCERALIGVVYRLQGIYELVQLH